MDMSRDNVLENNFRYHAPTPEQVDYYMDIRNRAKDLAYLIKNICPDSRERSLALTKLEETVMWANASIARSGGL